MNEATLQERILQEAKKGNVVFMGLESPMVVALDEFVKQPVEGILYDLNRSPEVVLTFLDDPKWVNDYAASMVITHLKAMVDALRKAKQESEAQGARNYADLMEVRADRDALQKELETARKEAERLQEATAEYRQALNDVVSDAEKRGNEVRRSQREYDLGRFGEAFYFRDKVVARLVTLDHDVLAAVAPTDALRSAVISEVMCLKEKHSRTWRDREESYWMARLTQEIGELASSLVGDHKDSPDWELKQIATISLNWLEMRAGTAPEAMK